MKKPALVLSAILTLLVFPAHAAMIVNDHFDGSDISPSWNVSMFNHAVGNTTGWDYQVKGSQLTVNQIYYDSSPFWAKVTLSQSFSPIDDFNAEIGISWETPYPSIPTTFGISLYDAVHQKISDIKYHNFYSDENGHIVTYPSTPDSYDPSNSFGTASMVRENGVISYYWDDTLLTSHNLLNQATTLELWFQYTMPRDNLQLTTMSVDYVTLEGDPVDLSATPEPGTMMLLGSALGLGAWWQRRRKRRA